MLYRAIDDPDSPPLDAMMFAANNKHAKHWGDALHDEDLADLGGVQVGSPIPELDRIAKSMLCSMSSPIWVL